MIMNLHIFIHYVMLCSEQLLPNLLKKVEVELREIDTHSCAWTVIGSAMKLKTGSVRGKIA